MPSRRFEARVDESDSARIDTFIRTWNGGSKRSASDAIRALIRLGLDAAARPSTFDERWLDLNERLARMELLLDGLGRCVAANPALAAWMLAQGNERGEAARERLAQSIEVLIQADWDERCRARGIPRPRHVPRSRRQPIGTPIGTPTRRDLYRMTLRLPTTYRERVHALAIRMDQPPLVALRRLVEIGIHVTEAETWHDEIDKLLDSARRIEVQLDEIGALATGTGLVTVHLWRRHKGLSDEWEQAVVNEVTEVAEGAWMNMLAGPPPPAPQSLLSDEDDDETLVEGA
jgi:hypothetical protein